MSVVAVVLTMLIRQVLVIQIAVGISCAGFQFALQRGVSNRKAFVEYLINLGDELRLVGFWPHHDVAGQAVLAAGYAPDVKVVQTDDIAHVQDRNFHFCEYDALGNAFQKQVQAFLEQYPGPRQYP